tara:strand:+ start:408 stop:641 length:234 start_codon:yes stop_codon:yes gene_type:complete
MPPDELSLDSLHADLVTARDAVAQLYRVVERSVLVLEQALQDREALIVRLSDMGVVADALMAERDAARSALEELRGC